MRLVMQHWKPTRAELAIMHSVIWPCCQIQLAPTILLLEIMLCFSTIQAIQTQLWEQRHFILTASDFKTQLLEIVLCFSTEQAIQTQLWGQRRFILTASDFKTRLSARRIYTAIQRELKTLRLGFKIYITTQREMII